MTMDFNLITLDCLKVNIISYVYIGILQRFYLRHNTAFLLNNIAILFAYLELNTGRIDSMHVNLSVIYHLVLKLFKFYRYMSSTI